MLLISVKSKKSNGGIAVWTEHYIKGCRDFGVECDIVNTDTITKKNQKSKYKRNIKDELIRTKRIYSQLTEKLKDCQYDVAHFNTNIGLFGIIRDYYLAKKISKFNIPIALHFHCDIQYWCSNFLIKFYLKKILALSNTNFVLCKNSSNFLRNNYNTESVLVPNFVDSSSIKKSKIINEQIRTIFFCGRVSEAKGAAEIFALAPKFPDVTFRLAGDIGLDVELWDEHDNIVLLQAIQHEKVLEELDNADIFLFPTHTEGFSLALAEAMSRGVPVVATDVGANADMIENKGGVIVPIGDVTAMEKAIVEMSNAGMRKNMSEWNINKVEINYTTRSVMQKFIEEYSKTK